jgi:hypothetical protein
MTLLSEEKTVKNLCILLVLLAPTLTFGADCASNAPAFSPTSETFELTCTPGQTIVNVQKAKSPVVKLNFGHSQEVTVSTHSGAKSSGHNGRNAQVCIWRSWDMGSPCGKSPLTESFNDWDGKAACSLSVPSGPQYVRALQMNENADEQNTTIVITCR